MRVNPAIFALIVTSAPLPLAAAEAMDAATTTCPAAAPGAPVKAAGDAQALGSAMLALGKRADVALLPTPEVRYPLQPSHPGGSVSHGGLLTFAVAEPGTYRVAIGSAAWLDAIQNGQSVPSSAHGRAPDCSGLRKMVDFPLKPGSVTLQIAGNGEPTIAVLVTFAP